MKPILMSLVALSLAWAPALAHDYSVGDLTIDHPTARVTLQSRPAAGYMSIVNAGDATDRLISAASPKFERIELHTMVEDEGVMRMRALEAIEAPAGGEVMLEPGGMHLMLFGATEAFKVGDEFPVTLTFEKAGPVEVVLFVEKPGHGEVDHSNHGSHSGQTN